MRLTTQLNKAFVAWSQVEPALRVPRNDREYRQLVKPHDRLMDQVGKEENHPLASLMEVLGVLIEKGEDEKARSWRNQKDINFMPDPKRAREPFLACDKGKWIIESIFGAENKNGGESGVKFNGMIGFRQLARLGC